MFRRRSQRPKYRRGGWFQDSEGHRIAQLKGQRKASLLQAKEYKLKEQMIRTGRKRRKVEDRVDRRTPEPEPDVFDEAPEYEDDETY